MNKIKLLICQPNRNALSETFIRNHIEYLDADTAVASELFAYTDDQSSLKMDIKGVWSIAKHYLSGLKPGNDWRHWVMTMSYMNAIQTHGSQIALLEYGTHAVDLLEACRRKNLPFVVHFHGFDGHHTQTLENYREKYVELFEQAQAIVVVSEKMKESLMEIGAPENKIHKIIYGVHVDHFSKANPKHAEPICLAVGRMVEKKAPHLTILAFKQALETCPDAKLIFLGDGPLRGPCMDLVNTFKLNDSVEFLGSQSHETVMQQMRNARLFVQHSVTALDGDSEGAPNAVLEASCSGLPVISTRHAGIPEIIINNKTGLLVDEKDVQGMAAAMVQLLNDPDQAEAMGAEGRKHVSENFHLKGQIEKLNTLIVACVEDNQKINLV